MPDGIIIRRAGPDDVPALIGITDAAYSKWIPVIGRKPAPMMADHAANVVKNTIRIAERDGKAVALMETIYEPDCIFIESLAVVPGAQGSGIANGLLVLAEQDAREMGLACVRLLTNKKFEDNITFYERRGFEREFESAFMGGVTLHMIKQLG